MNMRKHQVSRRRADIEPHGRELDIVVRPDDFGELLNEAYVNKQQMNPHVADNTIADELYRKARQCGALGGKLLGAGGGGFLALYCPTDRHHELRQALEAIGGQFVDFAFDSDGLQVWRSDWR